MILHSATQHGNHSPFGVVVSILGAFLWSIMENMQQPRGFALMCAINGFERMSINVMFVSVTWHTHTLCFANWVILIFIFEWIYSASSRELWSRKLVYSQCNTKWLWIYIVLTSFMPCVDIDYIVGESFHKVCKPLFHAWGIALLRSKPDSFILYPVDICITRVS